MKKGFLAAGVWALAVVGLATTAMAVCGGDCSGDGEVTVNELIIGVNIALGSASVGQCNAIDANGDGDVTINEIISAVNAALAGCPVAVATPTPTRTPTPGVVFTATPAIVPPGVYASVLGTWSGQAVNETTGVMKDALIKVEVSGGKIVVTDLRGNVFKTHAITVTAPTPYALVYLVATEQLQLAQLEGGQGLELNGTYSTVTLTFPPTINAVALILHKES